MAPLFDVVFTNERASVALLRGANPQHPLPAGGLRPGAARAGAERGGAGATTSSSSGRLRQPGRAARRGGLDGHRPGALRRLGPDRPGHPLRPHVHGGLVDNAQRRGPLPEGPHRAEPVPGHGGAPAESLNPRAYELAADGVFTLSQPPGRGGRAVRRPVPTFTTPTGLEARVRRTWPRRTPAPGPGGLPARVAEDTYHHRAAQLVAHLS